MTTTPEEPQNPDVVPSGEPDLNPVPDPDAEPGTDPGAPAPEGEPGEGTGQ